MAALEPPLVLKLDAGLVLVLVPQEDVRVQLLEPDDAVRPKTWENDPTREKKDLSSS